MSEKLSPLSRLRALSSVLRQPEVDPQPKGSGDPHSVRVPRSPRPPQRQWRAEHDGSLRKRASRRSRNLQTQVAPVFGAGFAGRRLASRFALCSLPLPALLSLADLKKPRLRWPPLKTPMAKQRPPAASKTCSAWSGRASGTRRCRSWLRNSWSGRRLRRPRKYLVQNSRICLQPGVASF